MGVGYWQTPPMGRDDKRTPRQVLSKNLRALMESRPDLGTIKKIVEASKSNLSNGKVGRIYAASHTTDIDTLAHLAELFGLQPWQLLVEDLKPEALPQLFDRSLLATIQQLISEAPTLVASREQLQVNTPKEKRKLGTALQEALTTEGVDSDARGEPGAVQKPKARRRP